MKNLEGVLKETGIEITAEQQVVLDRLNVIRRNIDIYTKLLQKGQEIISTIKKENDRIDPYKYILWHKFWGSTIGSSLDIIGFDTEDRLIEKYIQKAIDKIAEEKK